MGDKFNYLVIEGNIGAGKTTLSKLIAKKYNAKLILEKFGDNPFLAKFYNDPKTYSFQVELSFLADRYHQLNKEISSPNLFNSFTVADYYFMKSLIFANATLTDDELNLYRNIFNIVYKSIPRPDLYVYLHAGVERLLENIKKRGREYEQNIKPEYLYSIQKGYFEFFKQQPDTKFLIIDVNDMDFIENQSDVDLVLDVIFNREYQVGVNRILL